MLSSKSAILLRFLSSLVSLLVAQTVLAGGISGSGMIREVVPSSDVLGRLTGVVESSPPRPQSGIMSCDLAVRVQTRISRRETRERWLGRSFEGMMFGIGMPMDSYFRAENSTLVSELGWSNPYFTLEIVSTGTSTQSQIDIRYLEPTSPNVYFDRDTEYSSGWARNQERYSTRSDSTQGIAFEKSTSIPYSGTSVIDLVRVTCITRVWGTL